MSLEFVLKGLINNIPALVQIMAWRSPGDKPWSEPMMVIYWRIDASLGLNELKQVLHRTQGGVSNGSRQDISLGCVFLIHEFIQLQ